MLAIRTEADRDGQATNLRKAPGTDSEAITRIPYGAMVNVGDCRNGWCRVSWKGQDGYAAARNLSVATAPQWPTALAEWRSYYCC
jgi:SH3-like domain-containing protein